MKLISVSFNAIPRLPGVRAGDLITITLDKPPTSLKEWRLSIRGQQVFLISPAGWIRDQSVKRLDPKGPVTVFEVPRADVTFEWATVFDEIDAVLKSGKYDSEPFGWTPTPVEPDKPILAQIPAGQMGDA